MQIGCQADRHLPVSSLHFPRPIPSTAQFETQTQEICPENRQHSLSSTRSGLTQGLIEPNLTSKRRDIMADIRDQGMKREREPSVTPPEFDASLLHMWRSGSLNQQTDLAMALDSNRPVKRQMLQSGMPWGSQNLNPQSLNTQAGQENALAGGYGANMPRMSSLGLQNATSQNLGLQNLVSLNLKSALGTVSFAELRTNVIAQQELFNTHLKDLHAITKRQNKSVHECPNRTAMQAELDRLWAEQDNQTVSDNTVQQEDAPGLQSNSNLKQKGSSSSRAETNKTADTQAGKNISTNVSEAQRQGFGNFPPGMMPPPSSEFWNMQRQNYLNQYNQQGMAALQGWGMPPMMGPNFSSQFPGPYGGFGMMPPPMDPMLAWYTLHYGQQYHQAMQNQANAAVAKAQQEAREQDKIDAENNQGNSGKIKPVRWWQDPEKVFGLAADPAVLQNYDFKIAARNRAQERLRESRSEATSKPPTHKRPSKQEADVASEKGQSFEKATKVGSKPKSGSLSGQVGSKEGHQKAGSGVSAFKSLATKSGRRPPTRAESIGSEMSRSGADRSPMDDADSSDLNPANLGPNGPST